MSSDDDIAELEAWLQRAYILKVECKAAAERKAAEDCCLTEEKVAVEAEE